MVECTNRAKLEKKKKPYPERRPEIWENIGSTEHFSYNNLYRTYDDMGISTTYNGTLCYFSVSASVYEKQKNESSAICSWMGKITTGITIIYYTFNSCFITSILKMFYIYIS